MVFQPGPLNKAMTTGLAEQSERAMRSLDGPLYVGHGTEAHLLALRERNAAEDRALGILLNAQDRPAERAMDALDTNRVAAVERPLPGLEPSRREQQAERVRAAHEAQERLFPQQRREPVVGTPEQMSEARNAELFPRGTDNENEQ